MAHTNNSNNSLHFHFFYLFCLLEDTRRRGGDLCICNQVYHIPNFLLCTARIIPEKMDGNWIKTEYHNRSSSLLVSLRLWVSLVTELGKCAGALYVRWLVSFFANCLCVCVCFGLLFFLLTDVHSFYHIFFQFMLSFGVLMLFFFCSLQSPALYLVSCCSVHFIHFSLFH